MREKGSRPCRRGTFQEGLKATELHRNLLRLYSSAEQIRVVTTNFDLLFEQAAEEVFDDPTEVFQAPTLPPADQSNGIVHIHGVVSSPDEMVLTNKDFGRAYLTEGSALRFLLELFSNFTTLFVGHSHNDTIMRYMTSALSDDEEEDKCFALTGEKNNDIDWNVFGIEPIIYPQSSKGDYSYT